MKLAGLLLILAGTASALFATEVGEIVTQRVRGEWMLSPESEISPKEAFFRAQNEARRKAIAAVCGERFASWDTLVTDSSGQNYSGVVVSDSVGIVHSVKELRRGWTFPRAGEADAHESPGVFVEAEISVKKSSEKPDPSFTALVEGGKSRYKAGERDSFSVKVSQDAYLTVFWLNHDFCADVIFPANRWENNRISVSRKAPEIPLYFDISDPKAKHEAGTLFFVLTKKHYPFLKSEKSRNAEENHARIERWMSSIPVRERFIYAIPFIIER